jgi:hypothetical protein
MARWRILNRLSIRSLPDSRRLAKNVCRGELAKEAELLRCYVSGNLAPAEWQSRTLGETFVAPWRNESFAFWHGAKAAKSTRRTREGWVWVGNHRSGHQ